jgi:hypothetical protein
MVQCIANNMAIPIVLYNKRIKNRYQANHRSGDSNYNKALLGATYNGRNIHL